MYRKRLPEIDELYRGLIKERNRINNLNYFMKTVINPNRMNKLVDLESEYIWTEMDNSEYVDNSELLKNIRNK